MVCASLPQPGTALLNRALLNRSFYHATFCMTQSQPCIDSLLSLMHNIVCTSDDMQISFPNSILRMPLQCHYYCLPTSLLSPDSTVIRMRVPAAKEMEITGWFIVFQKRSQLPVLFTTGIWDSLGARSEGQQAKHPSWHTKLVVVWISSKHLTTHYPELQLQSPFDKWNEKVHKSKCFVTLIRRTLTP